MPQSSGSRRRRHRRRRTRNGIGPLKAVATIAVTASVLLAIAHLATARRDLLFARTQLQAARTALTQRDEAGARSALTTAADRAEAARTAAAGFPLRLLNPVPVLGSPGRALSAAARAGLDGVAAGNIMVDASASFPTSASSTVDGHDLSAFHAAAARSVTAVEQADRSLAGAEAALGGAAGAALPPVSGPARAMRDEIGRSRRQLAGATRGLALLGDLTLPEADVRLLLLSQDTLELRPTGGFIGSYGVLHFFHGTAKLEKYAATEDLPDPVPPMAAPAELATYLTRPWSVANANWSPDFPSTATAAVELFRRQGGGQVDGVLGLTELATARLIGALGSLQLPDYAKPVVQDGFDTRVVFEVEQKQPVDVPRKKFLIELANVLFERLFSLPADKLPAVADAVRQSIGAGDVQLWFKEPARQQLLAGTQVEGRLPQTAGDFFMLVDSNMTGSKANLEVTKVVDYRVQRDKAGRFVAHVQVDIHDDGPASVINPLYNAYLRVYAPAGSSLIPDDGFRAKQLARDGPFEVFGQSLLVGAKQSGTVTFDYVLPATVAKGGSYHLTWLRQVGTARDDLRLAVLGQDAQFGPDQRSLSFTSKR
jgi:hypothetical protein